MAERPGTELIVERRERLFVKKHALVLKKTAARPRRESNGMDDYDDDDVDYEYKELPNGNRCGELHGAELELAERAAAARPGGTMQLERVIERIIATATANVRPSPAAAPSSIALISVHRISELLTVCVRVFVLRAKSI